MFEAGNASTLQGFKLMKANAAGADMLLRACPLRDWRDLDAAELKLLREPVYGRLVLFDRVTSGSRWNIFGVVARRGLPAVFGSRYFVDDGGRPSYGVNWSGQPRRSAEYIARIFNGAKPANLAVERPTEFEPEVNLRRARALRITVPPSVRTHATEVIE